jgi:hypothetical protein
MLANHHVSRAACALGWFVLRITTVLRVLQRFGSWVRVLAAGVGNPVPDGPNLGLQNQLLELKIKSNIMIFFGISCKTSGSPVLVAGCYLTNQTQLAYREFRADQPEISLPQETGRIDSA